VPNEPPERSAIGGPTLLPVRSATSPRTWSTSGEYAGGPSVTWPPSPRRLRPGRRLRGSAKPRGGSRRSSSTSRSRRSSSPARTAMRAGVGRVARPTHGSGRLGPRARAIGHHPRGSTRRLAPGMAGTSCGGAGRFHRVGRRMASADDADRARDRTQGPTHDVRGDERLARSPDLRSDQTSSSWPNATTSSASVD